MFDRLLDTITDVIVFIRMPVNLVLEKAAKLFKK